MKKIKLTTIIFAICCVSFLAFLAFNPSHAYFQSHAQATGVNTAKVDLLFDKFNANADGSYTIGSFSGNINTDPWGTIKNPYVMTGKNHVNNLFILQRSGYFANKKEADGTTPRQSYFVVSNKNGTPVVIDCNGMTINPIGSATNPFTGNIQGAPLAGTAAYGSYTVSQSTIANLNVVAVESTPDIGFFGTLGYTGKVTEGKDATATTEEVYATLDGFAASIDNILFADIAISANHTVGTDWWTTLFKDHTHYATDHAETHHVGIIAGHAMWATIKNTSVYYAPGTDGAVSKVAAFNLSGSNTNFYSIIGLLGTLENVNPTTTTVNGKEVFSAEKAISDVDLTEELLSGGGGDESGTLTGYMLAKNIFDRNENTSAVTTLEHYAEAYKTTDMKETVGGKLQTIFTEVSVNEGWGLFADEHTYYYFCDSIFTFAMSSEFVEGVPKDGYDHVVRIWDLNDASRLISFAASKNDWEYGSDPSVSRFAHKLTAVSPSSLYSPSDGTKSPNKNYVLGYWLDNKLYVLDITNSNGYVSALEPQTFTLGEITYETKTDANGNITEMYVIDGRADYLKSSFTYMKGYDTTGHQYENYNGYNPNYNAEKVSLTSADGNKRFGITSTVSNNYYGTPSITTGTSPTSLSSNRLDSGASYWYQWVISSPTSTNSVTVSGNHRCYFGSFLTDYNYTYYSEQLVFDTNNKKFEVLFGEPKKVQNDDSQAYPSISVTSPDQNNLLLFEVASTAITISDTKNAHIKEDSTAFQFDPSSEILFAQKSGNNTTYTLTPLESLKWNDSHGEYLTQLNHAVKMAKVTSYNDQLNWNNLMGDNGWGDLFQALLGNNSGGVVPAPVGTNGTYFTIPAGMIAFDILEASTAKPSYINIIVAINPEQGSSSIGLWPIDDEAFQIEFSQQTPQESFDLPVSDFSLSSDDITNKGITISGRVVKGADGKYANDGNSYYTVLGGKIALVGYSFEVTEAGLYFLGSMTGPMTVCYFSVSGAAGAGGDGTGGSPLGDVDFVYDNGSNVILTVDKKFSGGTHIVSDEDPTTYYYPSYYYIRMLPTAKKGETAAVTIPSETLHVRRYLGPEANDRRRYIQISKTQTATYPLGISSVYEDNLGT